MKKLLFITEVPKVSCKNLTRQGFPLIKVSFNIAGKFLVKIPRISHILFRKQKQMYSIFLTVKSFHVQCDSRCLLFFFQDPLHQWLVMNVGFKLEVAEKKKKNMQQCIPCTVYLVPSGGL